MNSGWCIGECIRIKKKGDFSVECVYVFLIIIKFLQEILVRKLIMEIMEK